MTKYYVYKGGISTIIPQADYLEVTSKEYKRILQKMSEGFTPKLTGSSYEMYKPERKEYVIAGKLEVTFDELPQGAELYKAELFYTDESGKLIKKDNDFYEKEELKKELYEKEQYLRDTDYIANKIIESGLSLTDFLALDENKKYTEILSKREATRVQINQLRRL